MSFWLIPKCTIRTGENDAAILIPAEGLPDLTRALSRDHLREWVKHVKPEAWPEQIDDEADHLWQLVSAVHRDDYVLAMKDKNTLALGEITEDYHHEPGEGGGNHVWPVRWIEMNIPLADFEMLRPASDSKKLKEIRDSDARIQFRKYLPSWQTKTYMLFKWVSVIILVAELAFFWPRSK